RSPNFPNFHFISSRESRPLHTGAHVLDYPVHASHSPLPPNNLQQRYATHAMKPASGGQASLGGGASSRPPPTSSLASKGAPEGSTYSNGRSSGGGGGSGGLSLPGRRPAATTVHPMPRPSPLAGRTAASASGGM
ncbi:unnamed protein product, partial [Ectocarpus sp. 8 AP-2014]